MSDGDEPALVLNAARDAPHRDPVSHLLREAGYTVREAASVEEARQVLAQERVDLLVLGPDLPGRGLARLREALRALLAGAAPPVLHLGARLPTDEVLAEGLDDGSDAYLLFPPHPRVFLANVRAMLRAQRLRRERDAACQEAEARSRAHEEAQRTLDSLLEHLPEGVVIVDAPGLALRAVSRYALELGAMAPQEVRELVLGEGQAQWEVYAEDAEAPLPAAEMPLNRALQRGEVTTSQVLTLRRGDGSVVHLSCSAGPIRDASGSIVGGIISWRDITGVRQSEQERAREGRLLATIVENVQNGIAYLDRDFRYLRVNEQYARLARRTPGELLGRSLFDVYPSPEARALFEQARDTGEPVQREELRLELPELGVTYWNGWLSPLRDEDGQVYGLVLSLVEVTEQVRQREQLVEAQRARVELMEHLNAEISHRTKNNLAMAAGLLQMQMAQLQDPQAASALQDAASRLLTFARLHEQLQTTAGGDVDLLSTASRLAEATRQMLASEEADIRVRGRPTVCSSRAAANLAVVINELLTNAVKHGGPGLEGRLRVDLHVALEGGRLHLSVWSSGNPVPEGFDAVASPTLGLRLVRGLIVEQYHGHFSLHPRDGGTLAEVSVDAQELG